MFKDIDHFRKSNIHMVCVYNLGPFCKTLVIKRLINEINLSIIFEIEIDINIIRYEVQSILKIIKQSQNSKN